MEQPLQTLKDEDLLELIHEGNRLAFKVLYERYWKKLYSKAYERLRSKEEVEEIIQDLFVNLWTKKETLTIHSSFSGYIFTALKHKIFNHYHSQAIHSKYQQEQSLKSEEDESTLNEISYQDLLRFYNQSLSSLPEKSKLIFELSRNNNFTMNQIAHQLSISNKTVEYHISRSLQVLRKSLKEFLPLLVSFSLFLF